MNPSWPNDRDFSPLREDDKPIKDPQSTVSVETQISTPALTQVPDEIHADVNSAVPSQPPVSVPDNAFSILTATQTSPASHPFVAGPEATASPVMPPFSATAAVATPPHFTPNNAGIAASLRRRHIAEKLSTVRKMSCSL